MGDGSRWASGGAEREDGQGDGVFEHEYKWLGRRRGRWGGYGGVAYVEQLDQLE
jgi:hypothetical protein